LLRLPAFDNLQAAAVKLEQLTYVLLGLGSGGSAEPGGRRGGTAYAGRNGHKFKQIEGDVFMAPCAEIHVGLDIHFENSPKRMLAD
jgi:hypothetical protein